MILLIVILIEGSLFGSLLLFVDLVRNFLPVKAPKLTGFEYKVVGINNIFSINIFLFTIVAIILRLSDYFTLLEPKGVLGV